MEIQRPLDQEVYNEQDLLNLLGIGKRTLDDLRQDKEFPFIKLTAKLRVYLAVDVLKWLESHRQQK